MSRKEKWRSPNIWSVTSSLHCRCFFSFAFGIVSLSTCSYSTFRAESMMSQTPVRSSSLLACRLGTVKLSTAPAHVDPIIDIFLGTGRSAYKSQLIGLGISDAFLEGWTSSLTQSSKATYSTTPAYLDCSSAYHRRIFILPLNPYYVFSTQ